jgi:hypothetical protein
VSGNKLLLDIKVIVYALKGLASVRPYFDTKPFESVLTAIEILGVKDIKEDDFLTRQTALDFCSIVPLTLSIKLKTIELKGKLKCPHLMPLLQLPH